MALKLRTKVNFPAQVTATSPLILDKNGASYNFRIDENALLEALGDGLETKDSANLAALGAVEWIDPTVLTITGRTVPTENILLIANTIVDATYLNGDPAEHYFIGVFCNNDTTYGNLLTVVKASDGTIAAQASPREVDRSGDVTILEFGSAPRVKLAINYSQLGITGVLLNDALSPLFIRRPPAIYKSKVFKSAIDKMKTSMSNPMRGEYITAIGDSETWGFGASGASTTVPNTGALTDARNNTDAPCFFNKFAKWVGQKYCDGEGFSTTDPLSAPYAAGTREYRKIFYVDACYDPQFVVVNTSTNLPVAKTITTVVGSKLGYVLDLQPGQELHFRHVGDWWKLMFTGQSTNSDNAVRPVVTIRGVLNAGSANSVTTYQASPSNGNLSNFFSGWDDWRIVIANPAGGALCRIECIENHRAAIIVNNGLIGTWSGQWAPGTTNFDTGVSNKTTTLICQLGKNDRILASVGSTTGADNPTRTRQGISAIVVGTWANKLLADVILMTGSKAVGTKEITGDPATYGYSMAEVSEAVGDVARTFDLSYLDYYGVSAANDVPVYVSNGTTTSGSASVTGITSTATLRDGMAAVGTGIPTGTTITVTGSTTVTLSANATASGTVSINFGINQTSDGLHSNDTGHHYQYEVMSDACGGTSGGKYRPGATNYAPLTSPAFFTGATITNTAAGAVATTLTLNAVNTTSGETHTGKFTAQDNGAGTIRALFQAPGTLNAGAANQGLFAMTVEDGSIFMTQMTSTAGGGGTVMSLYDRTGAGAVKVQLNTVGTSTFSGGGLTVSGGNFTVSGTGTATFSGGAVTVSGGLLSATHANGFSVTAGASTFSGGAVTVSGGALFSTHATAGMGYSTGAGGTVTQLTSRTTGVTLNKPSGAITMFSAAGSATAATFTVTSSAVAATDTIILNQKSGTNLYVLAVTAVAAGSFNVTFFTTGGTATDAPVINFAVVKAATS